MTTPSSSPDTEPRLESPSWTVEDERALIRRQRFNEQAVRLSSVLSAAAVVLGAVLSLLAVTGRMGGSDVPASPVDPLALETSINESGLSYENDDIAMKAGAALEMIRYPWRSELQGWEITFLEPRGRASGYTWSAEQRIEVFVKNSDNPERIARVLAHELGHAVDVTLNTGDDRRAWLAERGVASDTAWWPGSGRPDFQTGAGDFAEVFAAWQVGEDDFKSKVLDTIDEGDYDLIARLSLRNS